MRSTRLAALAALSMIVGSTAAVAQSAAPQGISARVGATTEGSNELRGRNAIVIGVLAGLVIIFILIGNSDRRDLPRSP